jgi:hypothetical protein
MRVFLPLLAAGLVLTAGPALAQPIPAKGLTVEEVATFLKSKGYRAEIVTENDGAYIKTGMEGLSVSVNVEDCKDKRCESVQFVTGFNLKDGMTYQRADEWNDVKRWATMSLDNDMDPFLSMDVSLTPGSSYEALAESISIWEMMIDDAKVFLDW